MTIQSYRHRYGNAPGDPALEPLEQRLAERPPITVPTIVLHGACDGVGPPSSPKRHARHFTARYERRVIPVAGHFLSRETPEPWCRRCATCLRTSRAQRMGGTA